MKYPNLSFKINQKLDQQMAREFLSNKKGGIDFGEDGILKIHPQLRKINFDSDAELNAYINNFYLKNKESFKKSIADIENNWHKIERKFFIQTDKLFDHLDWPKGKYIGFLSIFNCGPRFLEDKTFQIYYQAGNEAKFDIAHEMLHFQFYHYLDQKLPKFKNKNTDKIWELSEIFNALVMWQDEAWQKISAPVRVWNYPDHKKWVKKLRPIWLKEESIESLFEHYFSIMSEKW